MGEVKSFLDSVERSSVQTRRNYHLGLSCFQDFLDRIYNKTNDNEMTLETILQPLIKNEIDLYELLDKFVSYLITLKPEANMQFKSKIQGQEHKLSVNTITNYLTAVKSYLAYHDIDVIPAKFRRRVKIPKLFREDEEPIDAKDIRNILLACNNRRLKSYLLILSSGGMRAVEALAIRLKDIDFSVSPTRVHIRKEFAKTRVSRDIYISDEATHHLEKWIEWKYRDKAIEEWTKKKDPNDLVFAVYSTSNKPNPRVIYMRINMEFERLLKIANMDERKEGMRRRKITLHSFRRHAKGVISNQVNQDYSEWFLGHSKSPYYTLKEPERREIYATNVMRYLTFLDYSALEAAGRSIEEKLAAREQEIYMLKQRDMMTTTSVQQLSDQVTNLTREVQKLKSVKIL